MAARLLRDARIVFILISILIAAASAPRAAPYAAVVMDARTGEILHARNADTRLHPASLTKMMTLYVAFEAVEHGEIGLDTLITIPQAAANEPPSKLGLRAGQRIRLRYLIRAAAVKSANDAATAIAFAISGSESAFAARMTRTARAMGMTRTDFRNAHGLTQAGHLSTARDMTTLGRQLIFDFPQYYHLFSRRSVDAGVGTVNNTNRRLLNSYEGADGIKTGYTRAAGFNLVASAERGRERIIATVFGGRSAAARNARVAELLDMGFARAPTRVALRRPTRPAYSGNSGLPSGGDTAPAAPAGSGRVLRVSGAVQRSLRPQARAVPERLLVSEADILEAVSEAQQVVAAAVVAAAPEPPVISVTPEPRPQPVSLAAAPDAPPADPVREIVQRVSTSGGRFWGVNIGRYTSRQAAERILLQTALAEMSSLDGSLRRVVERSTGYDANFMGLTEEGADLACRRLSARGASCMVIGPG